MQKPHGMITAVGLENTLKSVLIQVTESLEPT